MDGRLFLFQKKMLIFIVFNFFQRAVNLQEALHMYMYIIIFYN